MSVIYMDDMFVYNVVVSFVDGLCMSHQIPEFYEWSEDDDITQYDKIKLIHVTENLFDYISNANGCIPSELLSITGSCARLKEGVKTDDFLITDGNRTLAVHPDSQGILDCKGKIPPGSELQVFNVLELKDSKPRDFGFNNSKEDSKAEVADSKLKIMELDSRSYYGLTRKEREMKDIIMEALFNLSRSSNLSEVRYWYVELFPKEYNTPKLLSLDIPDMIEEMYNFLREGWSDVHKEFGENIMKTPVVKRLLYKWEGL